MERQSLFSLLCQHGEEITPKAVEALHGYGDYYNHYGPLYHGDSNPSDCIAWWCANGHPRSVDVIVPNEPPNDVTFIKAQALAVSE